MIECMRNAAREYTTIDEQISFCEEKSKNIKLKAKPQTFIDIKNSLEKLKNPWIPVSERLPEEIDKYYLVTCRSVICGEFEQFTTVSYFSTFPNGDKSWEIEEEHGNNWMVTAWQPLPRPYKEGERWD